MDAGWINYDFASSFLSRRMWLSMDESWKLGCGEKLWWWCTLFMDAADKHADHIKIDQLWCTLDLCTNVWTYSRWQVCFFTNSKNFLPLCVQAFDTTLIRSDDFEKIWRDGQYWCLRPLHSVRLHVTYALSKAQTSPNSLHIQNVSNFIISMCKFLCDPPLVWVHRW